MLFALNSLVTTIANLFVGFFIYLRNPKRTENQVFFLLTTTLSLWIATLYFYYSATDPQWLLFLGRINFAFPTLTVYYLFRFIYNFPDQSIKFTRVVTILIDVLAYLMTFLAAFTPFIDRNEILVGTQRIVDYGPMYNLWLIYFAGLPIFALVLLFVKLRKAKGISKSQLSYLLAGTSLAYFFGLTTNVILPYLFGIYSLQPMGPLGTLFLTGLTAYAIIRHKFLDITAIVARAVSYTLVLAIVVILEVGILWLGTMILPSNIDRTLIAFAGSILLVMTYSSLRSAIAQLTDNLFFQGRYDPEDLLKTLTSIMVKEVEIGKLSKELLIVLTQEMRLNNAAIVILKDQGVRSIEFVGYQNKIPFSDSLLSWLLHLDHHTLIFEELNSESDKESFRSNNLSVIIPLAIGVEKIGYLLLGPKSSGDLYSAGDLEVLEIFAPQAAIAIKNAESYREIQEFNATLTGKVAERTRQLEESQSAQLKLKDEFVFIATHDLATPVTAISGFSSMISARKEKISPDLKTDLAAIDEASNRLKVLVNDLLQVARSDSGTIKVELTKVDAALIIEAAVREVAPLAKEKNVQISLNLSKDNTIQADAKKLAEIVENLISNGVKYNRAGGSLTITTYGKDQRLIIEFKDTGLGIDTKEQPKVFTKFFRSEEAEVRSRPGTGLGLFVVRMLTQKLGGQVSFKSKEGEGTTFWLEFSK